MDVEIRPADPSEAGALSALAVRAKAHWGYPEEWLRRWNSELTVTPEYLRANVTFVVVSAAAAFCLGLGGQASLAHRPCPDRPSARQRRTRPGTPVEVLSDPFAEAFYLRGRAAHRCPEPRSGCCRSSNS